MILAGDAADLRENIDDEIAPGTLWQEREDLAIDSIRKLKGLAGRGGELWPNHDMAFYRTLAAAGSGPSNSPMPRLSRAASPATRP